jgi:two-component system, NarL family, response regulator DesR
VVAGDPLARAGLAQLLAAEGPGYVLAGQAGAGGELPAEVAAARADVVVWDLGWDPGAALWAHLEHLADLGAAGIPALALLPDPTHAAAVWSAGIRGLLLRDVSADRLLAALSAVRRGLAVLDPTLAAAALGPAGPRRRVGPPRLPKG